MIIEIIKNEILRIAVIAEVGTKKGKCFAFGK